LIRLLPGKKKHIHNNTERMDLFPKIKTWKKIRTFASILAPASTKTLTTSECPFLDNKLNINSFVVFFIVEYK
jgi:hypothetical protein